MGTSETNVWLTMLCVKRDVARLTHDVPVQAFTRVTCIVLSKYD